MLSELSKMKNLLTDFYSTSDHKIGAAPGDVKVKEDTFSPLEMSVVNYNIESFSAKTIEEISEVGELKEKDIITWLIVNGFGGNDFLEKLKNDMGFHGLVIEDILNLGQSPKIEFLEDSTFIVLRSVNNTNKSLDSVLSIIVSESNLYLFCPVGKFKLGDRLRTRIEKEKGAIRRKGIDYLLFAIIDLVVDSYFPQIDLISNSIKEIDQNLFETNNSKLLQEIKSIRQLLNVYFDNLLPLKDIIEKLINDDSDFVKTENTKYYNHVLNHVSFLCERITRLKESTSDIMNLNISMNGQKMNEVMKVLTMMSSVFIPLSFICGLYGMNFDSSKSPLNMPELSWYYGYPMVIGIMITLTTGMLIYFYKKKWF